MNNIIQHNFTLNQASYEHKNNHQAGVIWLTGLSGSGKSTIANIACQKMIKDFQISILDGDDLRSGLNSDLGFTQEDRQENLRRTAHVANLLKSKGHIVLACFITPLEEQRKMIQEIIKEDFSLAYILADVKTCQSRDPKGLYAKALKGEIKNFTGIDSPFEEPVKPQLILDTIKKSKEGCALELIEFIEKTYRKK